MSERRHTPAEQIDHAARAGVPVIAVNDIPFGPPPREGDPNVIDGRTVLVHR